MNINITKLKEFLSIHLDSELFLENRLVKCSKEQKTYFDISTIS